MPVPQRGDDHVNCLGMLTQELCMCLMRIDEAHRTPAVPGTSALTATIVDVLALC